MLKYESYAAVLQEVPDEITLAINITGCPYRCDGCHSEYLREDTGRPLLADLKDIVAAYSDYITCVCFMGGDQDIEELRQAAIIIRKEFPHLSLCIYTGNDEPADELFDLFEYVKYGHYDKNLGGLRSRTTNQRMLKNRIDITEKFWPKIF